jgi:RNA polymerase-binding transcription factor DksA
MPVSNPTPTGKATASRARNGAAEPSRAESPRAATPRTASPRAAASRRAAHDPTPAATSAPATAVTAVPETTGGGGTSGTPAKKAAPQKKSAQKKAAAPRKAAAPARKAAPETTTPAKTAPVEDVAPVGAPTTARRSPSRRTGRRTAGVAAAGTSVGTLAAAPPGELAVREDESPWTAAELAEVQAELESDVGRLRAEITVAEHDLAGLMRDAGDGAGDDQADAGTATFEREQEISLANNSREMLDQSEHALERIALGTYGVCESCANPVGKLRLQAFPRATLCRSCKQKQERR